MPSLLVTGFQVLISEDYVLHSMLTHWYYRLTIQVNCTSSSLNLSHDLPLKSPTPSLDRFISPSIYLCISHCVSRPHHQYE
jgi:hypothetical protein